MMSLMGDSRKGHLVFSHSDAFFFYIKNALSRHALLQTSMAEAGAHMAEKTKKVRNFWSAKGTRG